MSIPFSASAQESSFFSPTMIPSLALWFDASDPATITQSGGTVSEWRDKSSNAYSVIQGTVGNRPTYATNLLNGLPGVQLSGTRFLYQVGSSMPNFSSSPATTVYMVAKNGSSMPNWNIINTMWFTGISGGTQRYHYSFGYLTTNGITLFAKGAAVVNPSSYVVPLNSNAIIGFSSSATSNFLFYNGSNTAYASSGALPSANNTTWFLFGDARTSTPPVTDENIYEYVGFNTELTRAQQQLVEGYLATKWGLQSSLSNGHPYKTTPLYTIPSLMTPATYPTSVVNNPQFDPRLIPGCILWLDGADPNGTGTPPANGATLTTWKDKSVSNFPFTSVGSAYSTSAVNGRPGINIGTNFFGYDPGSAQNNWQEVFAVGLWTGGPTFNNYNGLVTSSVDSDGGYGGGVIFIGDTNTTSWFLVGNTYTTPVLNGIQTYTAIPTIQTPFVVRTLSATAVNLRGLRFGVDRSFPDRIWQGFISEVLSYNTVLSSTQRQQVEAYLAQKWKVSSLSTQNIYAPGSYLTFVNAPLVSLPPRRAVQNNKFNPTQISGCQLWLDAADSSRIAIATGVSQLNDKSTNAYNLTQATTALQPSYSANLITFSSNKYLNIPQAAINNTATYSLFLVFNPIASTNWILQKQYNGVSTRTMLSTTRYWQNNTGTTNYLYWTAHANTGAIANSAAALSTSTLQVVELVYDASTLTMYRNGNVLSTTSSASYGIGNETNATNFTIGSWIADGTIMDSGVTNFQFGELLYYNTALTTTQRQQVEGYLAWKWRLKSQLPPDHPFFLIPPLPLS